MILESSIPRISLSPTKASPPPIEALLHKIREFVSQFLSTGLSSGICDLEELVRYLCLTGQSQVLVEQLTAQLTSHVAKTIPRDKDIMGPRMLAYHDQQLDKINFLSQLFQELEGRTEPKLVLNLFYEAELDAIQQEGMLLESLVKYFLEVVTQYREDRLDLKSQKLGFIRMSLDMGLFRKHISYRLQRMTNDYYQNKRAQMAKSERWIQLVEREISKEVSLHGLLRRELDTVSTVHKQLVTENIPNILELVCTLIEAEDCGRLKLLWKLTKLVGQQSILQNVIKCNIMAYQHSLQKVPIEQILLKKISIMNICEKCFDSDRHISMRIEAGFQSVLSQESTLANSMMSDYFVRKLAHGELSALEERVLFEMYKVNPSKDLLLEEFKEKLAEQILMGGNSLGLNAHMRFLSVISQFSGSSLTKPIQCMLNDVWRDGGMYIRQYDSELQCRVLNKHQWPQICAPELTLPDELAVLRLVFTEKYTAENPNHQLEWIHWLSTVTLIIDHQCYTFSQIQASMIFYISKAIRPMKRHQLATAMQIDPVLVSSHLVPLKDMGLIIQDANQALQLSFQDLRSYQYEPQYQSAPKGRSGIITDRALTVEASIVRLMKKRKLLERVELIRLVPLQIKKFKPTIEQINESLEALTAKEYVELVEGVVKYIPA